MRWEESSYHQNNGSPPVECIDKLRIVEGHYVTGKDFQRCPIENCKKCTAATKDELCETCEDPQDSTKTLFVDKTVTPDKCVKVCPKEEDKYVDVNQHCVNCPGYYRCKECDLIGCTKCDDGHALKKGDRGKTVLNVLAQASSSTARTSAMIVL